MKAFFFFVCDADHLIEGVIEEKRSEEVFTFEDEGEARCEEKVIHLKMGLSTRETERMKEIKLFIW
ncbi:hypothetical protein J27TS8_23430 [Robertmurraya siralis]|uniref:Uncharacterized protein n=1 Tax=Robertmurraya siralis TaxID=77777 RepID=A0A919WI32_9BACI|nr:hypothetical protein J27TS8_23430 [Robertmurraya siralis]